MIGGRRWWSRHSTPSGPPRPPGRRRLPEERLYAAVSSSLRMRYSGSGLRPRCPRVACSVRRRTWSTTALASRMAMEVVHHHGRMTEWGHQGAGVPAPRVQGDRGDAGQLVPRPGTKPAGHRGPGAVGHHLQQPAAIQVDQASDPPGRCDPRGLEEAGLVHPEGGHALQESSIVYQLGAVVLADLTHPQAMRGPRCCSGGPYVTPAAQRPMLHDEEPCTSRIPSASQARSEVLIQGGSTLRPRACRSWIDRSSCHTGPFSASAHRRRGRKRLPAATLAAPSPISTSAAAKSPSSWPPVNGRRLPPAGGAEAGRVANGLGLVQ